jgi:hypothetical protein
MQTAAIIAKKLEMSQVQTTYLFSEAQHKGLMDKCPIDALETNTKSFTELNEKYDFCDVKFVDTVEFK